MTTHPTPLPDEDRLVLPTDWRPAEPKEAYASPDPEAPGLLRELLLERRGPLSEVIEIPENARYAETARAYLDGEADPLGAAVAAAVLDHGRNPGVWDTAVDAWLLDHGLEFAVAAMITGGGLFVDSYLSLHASDTPEWTRPPVLLRSLARGRFAWAHRETAKLRVAIAAREQDEYERLRAMADELRTGVDERRYAAFLFPREHRWVLRACAECPGRDGATDGALWPLVSTAEQLAALPGPALEPGALNSSALGSLMWALGEESLPALLATLEQRHGWRPGGRRTVLAALALLPRDEAVAHLLDHSDRIEEFEAACEAARRFPVRTLRTAAARAEAADEPRRRLLAAVVEAVGPETLEAAAERLEPAEQDALRLLRERPDAVPNAEREALPRLLVRPPWEDERRAGERPTVRGLKTDAATAVEWLPGERERWAGSGRDRPPSWAVGGADLSYGELPERQWADWADRGAYLAEAAAFGPDRWASAALERLREQTGSLISEAVARRILARFETAAVEPLTAAARRDAETRGALLPAVSIEVARLMAQWHAKVKSARSLALAWFDRHRADAARLLIPDALGRSGRRRDHAEAALTLLVRRHGPAAVEEAALSYGPEVHEAMRPIIETDPLEPVGGVAPSNPEWAAPALLPQVLLEGRDRSLPSAAVRHLIAALSVCTPDYEYEGVRVVAEACDRRSLAEFSRALFRRWVEVGTPPEGSWALTQLAYFADEETVAALVPSVLSWPGQDRHHLAVEGLRILRAIGTEAALQAIHQVASRTKFKALRRRAEELVGEIAAELGLTADQLADRLVPDFGLGGETALILDYGPRQFKVGFDERLKPFVADLDGKIRKSLPKPGRRDDAEAAEASRKRFSQLKKDLRAVAGDQVRRLERAMIGSRSWSTDEFERHFVEHPLMRHLTRRLIWTAVTADGTVSFRVDESSALADEADEEFELPEDAVVRLAHPLLLGPERTEAWTGILADYEILQPFEQLTRPVLSLTEEERRTGRLGRFEGAEAATGRLLGLPNRGWARTEPLDAGNEAGLYYTLPGGGYLNIELDPGIVVGQPDYADSHTLAAVYFAPDRLHWVRESGRAAPPERLDPVTASELLRMLSELTEAD